VTLEHVNDKRRGRRISLLFVLPLAAVALQFALIYGGYVEPYPALMMPSFGGNPTDAAGITTFVTVEAQVGFADGKGTEPLTLARLFAPMPNSMHNPTAWDVFRPTPEGADLARASDRCRAARCGWCAWCGQSTVASSSPRRPATNQSRHLTASDGDRDDCVGDFPCGTGVAHEPLASTTTGTLNYGRTLRPYPSSAPPEMM
jgi:hypothetical protein